MKIISYEKKRELTLDSVIEMRELNNSKRCCYRVSVKAWWSAMKDSEISPPAHFKRCSCEKQVSAHARGSYPSPFFRFLCSSLTGTQETNNSEQLSSVLKEYVEVWTFFTRLGRAPH